MLEDKLLIWKFKAGSKDAFRRIYDKYESYLLTLAANLLQDKTAAEDVVQDVFIGFVQSADKFHLTGTLKAYLGTCTANRARDYLRKTKHQRAVIDNQARNLASNENGTVQLVIDSEHLRRLSQAISKLSYEQREAVILRLQGGMKFKAIAELQNVSIKTAQSRYRYGLDKLRSILNGEVQK